MPAHCLTIIRAEHDQPSQVGQAMRDVDAALHHLIELRNDSATRADITKEEAELWRLKSMLDWVLSSIKIELEAQVAAE